MTEKIKALLIKRLAEIVYLIVGGLTTALNLAVYFAASELIGIHYIASNVAAWTVAVIFAYAANRKWAFESTNKNIMAELWLFILSRLFSLLLETLLLLALVEAMRVNDLFAKIIVALVVVVCNYVTSRLILFAKRD